MSFGSRNQFTRSFRRRFLEGRKAEIHWWELLRFTLQHFNELGVCKIALLGGKPLFCFDFLSVAEIQILLTVHAWLRTYNSQCKLQILTVYPSCIMLYFLKAQTANRAALWTRVSLAPRHVGVFYSVLFLRTMRAEELTLWIYWSRINIFSFRLLMT